MPHKKPTIQSPSARSASGPAKATYPGRPGQSALAAEQAALFPGIGITLGSYKHDPFRGAKSRPLPKPKKAPGRLRSIFTLKRISLFMLTIVLCLGLFLGGKFI